MCKKGRNEVKPKLQMKISQNNHSYLSPSKLNGIAMVKTTLLSAASNTDDTYTTAATTTNTTDLVDKFIFDKSSVNDNLTSIGPNCIDDDYETNDNILSTMAETYTEYKSPYRDYLLGANDNSLDYVDQLNGIGDTDDALCLTPKSIVPFQFSDCTLDASSTKIRSTTTASIATPKATTPDYFTTDFSPLNRCIQNIDDLLSFTATNNTTTGNTTASSTLNSWNEANSEFTRIKNAHMATSTRKPLLSAQNRFLSLSISPPLSRRQEMPVLRGTFVSL